MNKLRILFVTHEIPPYSGGGFYPMDLADIFYKMGHEVGVFSARPHSKGKTDYRPESNIKLFLPSYDLGDSRPILIDFLCYEWEREVDQSFDRTLQMFKPDIVHISHLKYQSLNIIDLAKTKKIPVVFTLHDHDMYCFRSFPFIEKKSVICWNSNKGNNCVKCYMDIFFPLFPLGKGFENILKEYIQKRKVYIFNKILFDVDLLVAPSRILKEKFVIEDERFKDKMVVKSHGLKEYPKSSIKGSKQERQFSIGFIGGSAPRKGLGWLLKSFKQAKIKAKLLIWGQGIEEVPKKLGRNIFNMGYFNQSDIKEVFDQIDMLIHPAFIENCSFVVREALYYKVPIIVTSTSTGGAEHLLKDGYNCLIIEPWDVRGLQRAIERFVNDRNFFRTINQNMHKVASVKTLREEATELLNEYYKLIDRTSSKSSRAKKFHIHPLIKNNPFLKGTFYTTSRSKEVEEYFNEYLKLDGTDPGGYFYLGLLYHHQRTYAEAIEKYEKVLSLKPLDNDRKINILLNVGILHLQLREYKEAEEKLKKALSLEPKEKEKITLTYYTLGSNLEREGLIDDAEEMFKVVVKIAEKISYLGKNRFLGGAYFHLGCIYRKIGDEEKAKHHFEKCLQFIPNHREARRNLSSIYLHPGDHKKGS